MPSGVVSGHQPTFMDSTTTEGVPVAESLPEEANAIEDSRKNDIGGKHAQLWQQLMRALSRILIPGKIWIPTNQIRALPARARVYRQLRARALQASRGI